MRVSVLRCDNHESPGRQVLEEIGNLARGPGRSVTPGDDGVQEAVRSEICRIEKIVPISLRVATTGSGGHRHRPRATRVILLFDGPGGEIRRASCREGANRQAGDDRGKPSMTYPHLPLPETTCCSR